MADEGMDPCECLWNHELAMRRLLSLLRQGQAYCTESECLDEIPGVGQQTSAGGDFAMMFLVMAMAVLLFVLRPRSLRQRSLEDTKPLNQDRQDPPAPPTIN